MLAQFILFEPKVNVTYIREVSQLQTKQIKTSFIKWK
jgi:hypothetical protein